VFDSSHEKTVSTIPFSPGSTGRARRASPALHEVYECYSDPEPDVCLGAATDNALSPLVAPQHPPRPEKTLDNTYGGNFGVSAHKGDFSDQSRLISSAHKLLLARNHFSPQYPDSRP